MILFIIIISCEEQRRGKTVTAESSRRIPGSCTSSVQPRQRDGRESVFTWARRRTRPRPGVTPHFQDAALNFQLLASYPGMGVITLSELRATQGPCSSCRCYWPIPRVCIARVAPVVVSSGLFPSYNTTCARDLTAPHGYTHLTQLKYAFKPQYFHVIRHICHLIGKTTHRCFPTHSCAHCRRSVTHGSCSDSELVKTPYKKERRLPGKPKCSNIYVGLTEFCDLVTVIHSSNRC